MGKPGEVLGGALADRLTRMWKVIIECVGDDPTTDPNGVYAQTWHELRARYAREADRIEEGEHGTALYVSDSTRITDVIETCIALDEL